MYENFIRDRICELRMSKNVSEYKMSFDLGHSRGYIHNISSGRSLPTMSGFLAICNYFGVTPLEFFDTAIKKPDLISKAIEGLMMLDDSDVIMILGFIDKLKRANAKMPV